MRAQLYRTPEHVRGGGILQTCDTSMHVNIAVTLLDDYACVCDPVVIEGSTTPTDAVWHYIYNGAIEQSSSSQLQIAAPWADPYPVCLTVSAYDNEAQQPCSTTVCEMIAPVPSSICTTLVADFAIASVDGQTITFSDLSTFSDAIAQAFWSFGDGTATASPSPTNTFSGPGPFEVCLTIVSEAPYYCSSTLCQWLYLGPGNVDCALLVEQGFAYVQSGDLVGALDTSRTSGMHSRIDWDFGDGATGLGSLVLHQYAQPGPFDLCGTLRVWGPLLADTCVTSLCKPVYPQAVGLETPPLRNGFAAQPNPCTDALTLAGAGLDLAQFELFDSSGRRVSLPAPMASGGHTLLDTRALAPGLYVLVIDTPDGARPLRIIKQ